MTDMRTSQISDPTAAANILKAHADSLSAAILGAHEDWDAIISKSPVETAGLTAGTKSSVIQNRIVFRLQQAHAEDPHAGLRVTTINGLQVAVLNDQLMLKLKKLNEDLRSRNIPTGQTKAFDAQEQLMPSTEGRLTNATAGYVPDRTGKVGQAVVACWDHGELAWSYDLLGNAGSAAKLFTVPVEPAPTQRKRIVAKPAAVDKTSTDSDAHG